jgi:alpha-galactosidase
VETNALFCRNSVKPIVAGNLPASIASLINQHITNQELVIDAVLGSDYDLAFQALFNDPTNTLPLDSSWELFNSILQINRDFLSFPDAAKGRP